LTALAHLLTRPDVTHLAGARAFSAGTKYAAAGAVRITARSNSEVTAQVQATRRYRVKLTADDGELLYECTCPVGEDGQFCKHCAAVAAEVADWGGLRRSGKRPAVTMDDVREHLMGYRKQALVDLVLARAEEDDGLRDQLLMEVAGQLPGGPDAETFKAALRDAIEPDGFVPYRESYDWYHGVDAAIDGLEGLLAQGLAETVIDICEDALTVLDAVGGSIDDSDGNVGMVARRLGDLHLLACRRARPDPVELGRRLLELELSSEHDAYYDSIDRYAAVLGKKGTTAFKEAAQRHWSKVPSVAPGQPERDGLYRHNRITHVMERLAARSGDPDELAAVLAKDLSLAYQFVRIAEVYREAGRFEEALDWAGRGLAAFPTRPEWRLRELTADELHRRGDHQEALKLVWAAFEESPGLTGYQRLHDHVKKAHADWPSWSDRALKFVRAHIDRRRGRQQSRWDAVPDRSSLVEIFLWRKEPEIAWREAVEGGCDERLWLQLASIREGDHPEDAVPIYQRRVERLAAAKNNQAYAEAVDVMKTIGKLMATMEPPRDFRAYVTEVRSRHRPKRNLMALLDGAGW
jgi:uncharacterized Zn finger protein